MPPEPSPRNPHVPRIFFDGTAWAFPFSMGASRFLWYLSFSEPNLHPVSPSASNFMLSLTLACLSAVVDSASIHGLFKSRC